MISDDHMVLRSDDFRGFVPKQLTVRTLTSDNEESLDSDIAFLPQNLVKEVMATAVKSKEPEITVKLIVSQKQNKVFILSHHLTAHITSLLYIQNESCSVDFILCIYLYSHCQLYIISHLQIYLCDWNEYVQVINMSFLSFSQTDEDGQDTDEEIEAAFRDVTKQRSDDQVLTDATVEVNMFIYFNKVF